MTENMMEAISFYQVDAFCGEVFKGNPAAVCPLDAWLSDELMQSIAMENNLSETAFFVKESGGYHIRWFTPKLEVKLCGHATLASSHVIMNFLEPGLERIVFNSLSGKLVVEKDEKNQRLVLDFPSVEISKCASIDWSVKEALGIETDEVYYGDGVYLVLLDSEAGVRAVQANFDYLIKQKLDVIITSKGDEVDFVSRCFAPFDGIPEDPVTGSAHCVLVPFWAKKLGTTEFHARQISQRGGELFCKLAGERVHIGGQAVCCIRGQFYPHGN